MADNFEFTWVSGDGGPLIVMEQKYLADWEGSEAPSNGRIVEADFRWGLDVATDYDLACDVEDYLGLIKVGPGRALVLSGDETATTWLPLSEAQEGILIRWGYANSEADIINRAEFITAKAGNSGDLEFAIEDSKLVLFVSAESGYDKIWPRLQFNLLPGIYAVSTVEYKYEDTSAIYHRFRRK